MIDYLYISPSTKKKKKKNPTTLDNYGASVEPTKKLK